MPWTPVQASGLGQFPILGRIITAIKAWSSKRNFSTCAELSRQSLHSSGSDEVKISLPRSKRSTFATDSASTALTNDAQGDAEGTSVALNQSDEDSPGKGGIDKTTKNELVFEDVYPFIRPGFVDFPPFRKIWNRDTLDQLNRGGGEKDGTASTTKQEKLFANVHPLIRRTLSSRQNNIRKVETSDQKLQPHEASIQESTSINELLERILIRRHIVRDINPSPWLDVEHLTKTTTDNENAEQTTDIKASIKALLYGSSHIKKEQYQQFQESQKAARREAMTRDIDDVVDEIELYFKSRQKKVVDREGMPDSQERSVHNEKGSSSSSSSNQVFGLQELMEASERFADDDNRLRGKSKKKVMNQKGMSDSQKESVHSDEKGSSSSSSSNQVLGLQELMEASDDGSRLHGKSKKKKKKKQRQL